MSAAFERGKSGKKSIYVPTRAGGLVQRATGTGDAAVIRGMGRMCAELRDTHRWTILDAIREKRKWTPPGMGTLRPRRFTLRDAYAYYASHKLDELEAVLGAKNLSEHLDGWMQWVRANRQAGVETPSTYWLQVTSLVKPGEPFPASELTKARVIKWLAGLTYRHRKVAEGEAPRGVSSGYKRKMLYAVKSFVRYLTDVGVLETDPLAGLRAPKKNPPRERWETEDRDRAIVAAAIPQYRVAFAFIKATGCDVGSAWRAQLGDLDLLEGTANIRGTKTDRRRVFRASIEPWALPLLREHVKGMIGQHTLLFPGLTNSGALHHHQRCCTAVGVAGYTLKDSRHSIGVRMRLAGRSFEEIAAQLGTSVYQAVTVYTRYTPSRAAKSEANA